MPVSAKLITGGAAVVGCAVLPATISLSRDHIFHHTRIVQAGLGEPALRARHATGLRADARPAAAI